MEFIYMLLVGSEWWEDAVIYVIRHPTRRVEIFALDTTGGYAPTYDYYKQGNLVTTSGSGSDLASV